MDFRNYHKLLVATGFLSAMATHAVAQIANPRPSAIVDLSTHTGVDLVKGQWRFADAQIIDVDHRDAGPDKKASGAPNRTHDISPHAGAAGFNDSDWAVVDPEDLIGRRTHGRLAFAWYRLRVTIPERVASFSTQGSTAVFEIVTDDYAEVWVDGKLPQVLGQTGGQLVAGWNAANRVLLTTDAQAGQTFQLAIFAANGPLSDPPANYVWVRSATLDFYRPGEFGGRQEVELIVDRRDPAFDRVVPTGARLERLASGFIFTEGPVWSPDGYLLFSDPNANRIYRWSQDGSVSLYRTKSGYSGMDVGEYRQPGSNGLAFDKEGRLSVCEHGNRRVVRIEKNGDVTVLADRYDGKRLNSPNDLVYRSDGTLFFTDPPFGLPKIFDDPRKELPYSGVFCLKDGVLKLLTTDMTGPNGIALSPDERFLYVGNWDDHKKVVMRYAVAPDGAVSDGRVFIDMTADVDKENAIDGLKIDRAGNLFVSGPSGVWVIAPDGKHLGTIRGPEHPHNLAWGSDDFTLYLAAQTSVYRLQLGPG